MAIIVSETGGNWSTATWYRAEAYQLDARGNYVSMTTDRYTVVTFANSGNLRKLVTSIGNSTQSATPVGRYQYACLQRGRVATMTLASPTVVTLTGHGFVGAQSGVTMTIASPCVVTFNSHGLCDGDQVGFTTTGALPTGLSNATVYYAKNCTTNTFEVCTTRAGASVNTSGTQSGTHSLWTESVQFTTTGALPTGLTANTVYFVDKIDANTFYLRSTPTGARINATVSQSGTHTCWDPKDYAVLSTDDVYGTGATNSLVTGFGVTFAFAKQAAFDTTASGWRFRFLTASGSGSAPYIVADATNQPFLIAWGGVTVSYTTNDSPVICTPMTIDQDVTFKGTLPYYYISSAATVSGFAGFICSPDKDHRAYSTTGAGNGMLLVNASAPRTVTVDGQVVISSQTGIYFGTEASPISYANKLTLNFVTQSYAGSQATASSFSDLSATANTFGSGATIVMSGAYPSQRYATLTADANTGQNQIIVDDASGFQVNDYVYISKHDIIYYSSLDATRYRIQSIASNTITLTTNIITHKRLTGGRVILVERGYGVQEYGQSIALLSSGWRTHGPINYYKCGVYSQNVQPSFAYSTTYRFFDEPSNRRSGGFYIGYCLYENYQANISAAGAVIGTFIPEREGALVENCISYVGRITGLLYKCVFNPSAGVTHKSGGVEIRNCFVARQSEYSFAATGMSVSAYLYVHDNVAHNSQYGISVGGTNGKWENNYIYASLYGQLLGNGFNCHMKSNTYERCSQVIYPGAGGGFYFSGYTEDDMTLSGGSPTLYSTSFLPDSYFDMTYFSPTGSMTAADTTYLAAITDGGIVRLISNNNTDGSITVWQNSGTTSAYTLPLSIPTATLKTPGTVTTSFQNSNVVFKTTGTYDLRSGSHIGTLTLTNTSGGSVYVKLNPSTAYTNSGPNITVEVSVDTNISLTNIVNGSAVQVYDVTTSTELYKGVPGTSLTLPITWTTNHSIRIRVREKTYLAYEFTGTLTSTGLSLPVAQVADAVYSTNNIDGSTVTEFSLVEGVIAVYVNDPDNKTTAQRLYNWYKYAISTTTFIDDQPNHINAQTAYSYVMDDSILIFNAKSTTLWITGANINNVSNTGQVIDNAGGPVNINGYFAMGGDTLILLLKQVKSLIIAK